MILDWLLNNKQQLKLKGTKLTWVDEWLPGYFDYGIEVEIDGEKYEGRGTDLNEELAFIKGAVEAFEKAVFKNNKLKIGGFSGHKNQELADIKAKLELIERDSFMCHYLTKTPFKQIREDEEKIEDIPIMNIKTKLKGLGINLNIYQMNTAIKGIYACACISEGINYKKPFGVITGLGCNYNKVKL